MLSPSDLHPTKLWTGRSALGSELLTFVNLMCRAYQAVFVVVPLINQSVRKHPARTCVSQLHQEAGLTCVCALTACGFSIVFMCVLCVVCVWCIRTMAIWGRRSLQFLRCRRMQENQIAALLFLSSLLILTRSVSLTALTCRSVWHLGLVYWAQPKSLNLDFNW